MAREDKGFQIFTCALLAMMTMGFLTFSAPQVGFAAGDARKIANLLKEMPEVLSEFLLNEDVAEQIELSEEIAQNLLDGRVDHFSWTRRMPSIYTSSRLRLFTTTSAKGKFGKVIQH